MCHVMNLCMIMVFCVSCNESLHDYVLNLNLMIYFGCRMIVIRPALRMTVMMMTLLH